jgi:hypothetical protein
MPEPAVRLEAELARLEDAMRGRAASYVPVCVAAALTFHAAHRNTRAIMTREDYEDALNMAAAALSRLIPVYRVADPRDGHTEVPVNLVTMRFARGATELRGATGEALRDLSVRHGELQSALSLVRRAGIAFTCALSPEPPPAVDLDQEAPARPR